MLALGSFVACNSGESATESDTITTTISSDTMYVSPLFPGTISVDTSGTGTGL